jgi:hypothetical protein
VSPDRAALILARHCARKAVHQQYREAGRKPASVNVREWHADADAYLTVHPELLAQAGTKIKTFAPRTKARKSTTSVVHIIGAK